MALEMSWLQKSFLEVVPPAQFPIPNPQSSDFFKVVVVHSAPLLLSFFLLSSSSSSSSTFFILAGELYLYLVFIVLIFYFHLIISLMNQQFITLIRMFDQAFPNRDSSNPAPLTIA